MTSQHASHGTGEVLKKSYESHEDFVKELNPPTYSALGDGCMFQNVKRVCNSRRRLLADSEKPPNPPAPKG
jgi:hypothetical protein